MTLLRYQSPWSLLGSSLQRELEPLRLPDLEVDGGDWTPSVDIQERSDRFCIRADLPGVNPEDVEITLEGGCLTLRGSRHEEKTEDAQGFRRTERVQGIFHRRFSLPDTVDAEGVKAESRHGVIEITVPKREKAQPRRITVKH